jgi:hypothetical protein
MGRLLPDLDIEGSKLAEKDLAVSPDASVDNLQ